MGQGQMNLSGSTLLVAYASLILFILGTILGSFINCAAGRIVEGKDWIKGKSHCSNCNHELGPLDLVPVLSYIFLGGKCRYCGQKFSPRNLYTELLLGICFLLTFLSRKTIDYILVRDLIIEVILLGLSLVDLDSYIIPDGFIVAGIVNWLISVLFVSDKLAYLKNGLIGGFSISLLILIVSLIMDKALGKESLGGGDIKLLFMVCLYTGVFKGFFLLFLSCVIGLFFVLLLKKEKIPFGPSISMATFVVMLYGDLALNWYLSLF